MVRLMDRNPTISDKRQENNVLPAVTIHKLIEAEADKNPNAIAIADCFEGAHVV